MVYYQQDVKKLGTILGVWAHPDDEAFCSAGIMAAAVQNGQRVVVITATKGDAGQTSDDSRWTSAEMAQTRVAELEKSLKAIGVSEHHWLGYEDGGLKHVAQEEAVQKIMKIVDDVKPDTIMSFDSDGITGHHDHRTVHEWSLAALKSSGSCKRCLCAKESSEYYRAVGSKMSEKHNIYFNVNQPDTVEPRNADVCLELSDNLKRAKCRALKAHSSQTKALFGSKDGKKALDKFCECECFIEIQS